MSAVIGALRAVLSLDSAAFDKGSKRAQASMSDLQKRMAKTSAALQAHGRKLSLAVTAPLAGMATVAVKSSLSTVDAQAKLAQSLGTTTKSVQVLSRAGDLAGVSMGQIEQATVAMTKRLSQAAAGTGPAVKALERLNLRAEDLIDMPLDERIASVQNAMSELVPEAERAGVAASIFGDRAAVMFTRIDAAVLEQAADEIDRFGVAVSDLDADNIEAANDAISALGLVSRGLANQLTVALAPVLLDLAEKAQEAGAWFSSLSDRTKTFLGVGTALAAALGPVAIGLGFVISGLAAIASPIGIAIVGMAALAGVGAAVAANWDEIRARYPETANAMEGLGEKSGVLAEKLNEVGNYWADYSLEQTEQAFRGLAALLEGDWKTAWDSAANIVLNTLGLFDDVLGGLPSKAWNWAVDMVDGFISGLAGWGKQLVSAAQDAWDAIWAEVSAWPGRFVQVGRDIIDGLILGINEAPGKVKNALTSLAGDALEWFSRPLGVQSPSKEFAKIGGYLIDGLNVGLDDNAQSFLTSLEDLAHGGIQTMQESFLGIEDVFSGVMDGTIASWGDALDVMKNSFVSWLKSMIQTALLNPITITGQGAFGMLGGAGGVANVAGMAGGNGLLGSGGLLSGVFQPGGILGSVGSFIGSSGGLGLLGGINGVITNTLANGLGGTAGYISSAMAGATASVGAFGAAIGAVAAPLAVVALAVGAFKEKVTVLKSGLQATVDGLDVTYQAFERTKRERFYGASTEESTRYSVAGAKWDPIREAIAETQGAMLDMAESLGIAESAFDGVSRNIRFDFADKNEQERLEELQEGLGKLTDTMAEAAFEAAASAREISLATQNNLEVWELFAQGEETASEAMSRLSASLSTVNGVLDYMNATLFETSLAGAQSADALAGLFGGSDGFASAVTNFIGEFYSEAEQLAMLSGSLTDQLSELGEQMPGTRYEFRKLVEAQDLTTEAGRELYAVLVQNASAFAQVLPEIEALTDTLFAAFSSTSTAVDEAIAAAESNLTASQTAARAWYNVADTLRDFVLEITNATADASTAHSANVAAYETALAAIKEGDASAAADFSGLARSLLDTGLQTAGSALEYQRLAAQVRSDAKLAAGIAELEGASEDVLATLYQEQIDILENLAAFLQLEGLTSEDIDKLDAGLQALLGDFDGTVGQFETALDQIGEAIKDVAEFSYDAIEKQISLVLDGSVTRDLPGYLNTLIENSAEGIKANVDFILRRDDLTPDLKWLATRGNWEAIQNIVFVAQNDMPRALARLAVSTTDDLVKNIRLAITAKIPDSVKRLSLTDTINQLVNVRAILSSRSSAAAKRLALNTIGDYVARIQAKFESGTPRGLRKLIREGSAEIFTEIEMALSMDGLTKREKNLLLALGDTATAGTIKLGGGFEFDPSKSFQVWFGSALEDSIETPMDRLRSSLGDLRKEIADQVKYLKEQAAKDAAIAAAQTKLQAVASNQAAVAERVQSIIDDFYNTAANYDLKVLDASGGAASTYIDENGQLRNNYDKIRGDSDDIKAFQKTDAYAQFARFQNSYFYDLMDKWADRVDAARQTVIDRGGIPAFAKGGAKGSGLAIVGEQGPELINSGPGYVSSASGTRAYFAELYQLMKDVKKAVESGDDAQIQLLRKIETHGRKTAKNLNYWEAEGLPAERAS